MLTEATRRWGPPRFSLIVAQLPAYLSWHQNTIGEEGLLSLQAAKCTHNECVHTTSFSRCFYWKTWRRPKIPFIPLFVLSNREWPEPFGGWFIIIILLIFSVACLTSPPDFGSRWAQYLIAIILNGQFPIFFSSKCELIFRDIFLDKNQEQNQNVISKTIQRKRMSDASYNI